MPHSFLTDGHYQIGSGCPTNVNAVLLEQDEMVLILPVWEAHALCHTVPVVVELEDTCPGVIGAIQTIAIIWAGDSDDVIVLQVLATGLSRNPNLKGWSFCWVSKGFNIRHY